MSGSGKKRGGKQVADSSDLGEVQARMTRSIISELRDDLGDLIRGFDAGTLSYVDALKHFRILLQEDLNNPLVGAVEVKFQKAMIPLHEIKVPSALQKKRGKRRGRK